MSDELSPPDALDELQAAEQHLMAAKQAGGWDEDQWQRLEQAEAHVDALRRERQQMQRLDRMGNMD